MRPPTWRDRDPPQADFFAAKGVLAGLFDDARRRLGRARADAARAVPASRPRRDGAASAASTSAGSARSTRTSPPTGTSTTPSPASRSTSSAITPPPAVQFRDLVELPGRCARTSRSSSPTRSPPRELLAVVRERRLAAARRTPRSSTSTATLSGSATGKVSVAVRLALPRRRPHADRRRGRAPAAVHRQRARAASSTGRSVPASSSTRSPSSAPPATPARWPRGCSTTTRTSS